MLQLFSPAKINLFLRVVGKRLDGYHELSTVLQTVDFGDYITLEQSDSDQLICNDPALPNDESNLVLKAVKLFRLKTGIKSFFKIYLCKYIPTQAGLGGGSSNAATVLWGCNQLSRANVSDKDLQTWSAEIGSDIPFFFSKGTAYCTGRGEHVFDIEPSKNPSDGISLVKPALSLSTQAVFSLLGMTPKREFKNHHSDRVDYEQGRLVPFNDFEAVVFAISPEMRLLKNRLIEAGFKTVILSGSGSSFYCIGKPNQNLTLLEPGLRVFPVSFLNRSCNDWYSVVRS